MDEDIAKMLELMEISFRDFEAAIPNKPKLVRKPYGEVYRFEEQDIYQAIIQKLAHAQSTVRAAQILLEHGYVQEQAALQRVVDEANEDILFLVYAVTNDKTTELHEKYLEAFWEEEFDDTGNPLKSEQKRPMVSRRRIRAYIANVEGAAMDPSRGIELARTIHKAYSGFVHGASPHIMDRYGGNPPKFHIKGMLGTPRIEEHRQDLWNYMYRTFISHILVAKALGAARHVEIMMKHLRRFEENAGKDYVSST
ncbi:MAG TPA: hypothetical protein ENJ28_03335 [Gammaproteobacteria bacterium]|nr:hypothetical protein [Gammaproteobacteria bacterium]